jgi:predicted membrane protein
MEWYPERARRPVPRRGFTNISILDTKGYDPKRAAPRARKLTKAAIMLLVWGVLLLLLHTLRLPFRRRELPSKTTTSTRFRAVPAVLIGSLVLPLAVLL